MVEELKTHLSQPIFLSALICICCIYGGFVPVRTVKPYFCALDCTALTQVSGRIGTTPSISGDGSKYSASLSLKNAKGSVRITNHRSVESEASAAGTIAVSFSASQLESCLPGRLYSLEQYDSLIEKGAAVVCKGRWSPKQNTFVVSTVTSITYPKTITGTLDSFRARCRLLFKRLLFSWGNAGALIISLLSGSRDYLETSVRSAFKNAGLAHILALSGMHLSFFSGIAGSTGRKMVGKRKVFLIQIGCILLFVWFAGLSPSLLRALLCSLLMLTASKTSMRSVDFTTVLAGVFLVHLVLFPQDSGEAAFLLSYGALAGILLISPIFTALLPRFVPTFFADGLSASLGAQIASLPVSVALFGQIMPIGIIASTIVSPLVTIFLTLSLFSIILSLALPFLSPLFGGILNVLYSVIVFFVQWFAGVPPVNIG